MTSLSVVVNTPEKIFFRRGNLLLLTKVRMCSLTQQYVLELNATHILAQDGPALVEGLTELVVETHWNIVVECITFATIDLLLSNMFANRQACSRCAVTGGASGK